MPDTQPRPIHFYQQLCIAHPLPPTLYNAQATYVQHQQQYSQILPRQGFTESHEPLPVPPRQMLQTANLQTQNQQEGGSIHQFEASM